MNDRLTDQVFYMRENSDWVLKRTQDLFNDKEVVVFGLPGAFTPTCSSQQLPGFEKNFSKLKDLGIDEVYCCSVNDSYVMNAWAKKMGIKNIKLIPDGSGLFTKFMGMLIAKDDNGKEIEFKAIARLDSPIEVAYYQNERILQYVLRQFLKK